MGIGIWLKLVNVILGLNVLCNLMVLSLLKGILEASLGVKNASDGIVTTLYPLPSSRGLSKVQLSLWKTSLTLGLGVNLLVGKPNADFIRGVLQGSKDFLNIRQRLLVVKLLL
jgi:hypothetical protein